MATRVLIVDDSSANRSILKSMLREFEFELFEAANGQEAMDKLGDVGCCDVALVDWNMPVMNGYDLVKNIRADKAYDRMNIMMVTTETEISQIVRALTAGANEYMMKPFTKEAITEKLKILGVI